MLGWLNWRLATVHAKLEDCWCSAASAAVPSLSWLGVHGHLLLRSCCAQAAF